MDAVTVWRGSSFDRVTTNKRCLLQILNDLLLFWAISVIIV